MTQILTLPSLPPYLPPVPEESIYIGQGPIRDLGALFRGYIYDANTWSGPYYLFGDTIGTHYAAIKDTHIRRLFGLSSQPPQPPSILSPGHGLLITELPKPKIRWPERVREALAFRVLENYHEWKKDDIVKIRTIFCGCSSCDPKRRGPQIIFYPHPCDHPLCFPHRDPNKVFAEIGDDPCPYYYEWFKYVAPIEE